MKVLFTGASGSGQSTIGRDVAERSGAVFEEADDIYWLPTDPPFTAKRDARSRLKRMQASLDRSRDVVVAGSVMQWGRDVENAFDVIFFLYVQEQVRVDRLRERELQRYGSVNEEFIDWASQYDAGGRPGRSLTRHEQWLAERTCPVVRLDAGLPVESLTEQALSVISDVRRRSASG